jgi:predicted ATPase
MDEPEVHRLKGELLLVRGGAEPEAEKCFQRAIEVARRQQAKSWELRATMSLCRLWQKQGKQEQARQALTEIYSWFTEGFDTPDLREATALLEELANPLRAQH